MVETTPVPQRELVPNSTKLTLGQQLANAWSILMIGKPKYVQESSRPQPTLAELEAATIRKSIDKAGPIPANPTELERIRKQLISIGIVNPDQPIPVPSWMQRAQAGTLPVQYTVADFVAQLSETERQAVMKQMKLERAFNETTITPILEKLRTGKKY